MSGGHELKKLVSSFRAAFSGVGLAVKNERNFRIHICFIFYVLVFAWLGNVSASKCLVFIICFGMVTAAELINSAIELLCDTLSDRFDVAFRAIKDMSSGAVLMCAIASAAVGLLVFLNPVTFETVFKRLFDMPYVAAMLVLSVPIAVVFVIRRRR